MAGVEIQACKIFLMHNRGDNSNASQLTRVRATGSSKPRLAVNHSDLFRAANALKSTTSELNKNNRQI